MTGTNSACLGEFLPCAVVVPWPKWGRLDITNRRAAVENADPSADDVLAIFAG